MKSTAGDNNLLPIKNINIYNKKSQLIFKAATRLKTGK
jgi:hypothetical protein